MVEVALSLKGVQLKLDINLIRGVLRRIGYAKNRTSYPFLSGDTYRSLADFVYEVGWDKENFRQISLDTDRNVLFVSLKDYGNFIAQISSMNIYLNSTTLILHNHDSMPSYSEIEFLKTRVLKIFCANWVGPLELASPLPLGLENFSYLRNGVPRDISKLIRNGLLPFENRTIELSGAFSISTNVSERSRAFQFLSNYPGAYITTNFISLNQYRELVANSKYILSPPGSGTDCHRTWEAIYLGAIPIVLRSSWGFPEGELPVLIVDDWVDVPNAILLSKIRNEISVMDLVNRYIAPFSDLNR